MEIRSSEKEIIVEGYVNAVERDSKVLSPALSQGKITKPFVERIKAGTFSKALQRNAKIPLYFNHRRQADGNIELKEDSIGLKAKAVIRDAEIINAAKEGKITGWSFAMLNVNDTLVDEGDKIRREIDDCDLSEVSILTLPPAYYATTAECRTDEEISIIEHRSTEDTGKIECVADYTAVSQLTDILELEIMN